MSALSLRSILVSAVAAAAIVSCFKTPEIEIAKLKCLQDEHCPEGYVCREGRCVNPGSPAADAALDSRSSDGPPPADGPPAQDVSGDRASDERGTRSQDGSTADASIAADAAVLEAGGTAEVGGTGQTGGKDGSAASGGAVGTGGTVGSGGAAASGGAVGTGGTVGSGGAAASGGAVGTGGTVGSGGAAASGGAVGTGGALAKFSFFVTSPSAMATLANTSDGFGGDLRFGETGPGAGLLGADKICAAIAETSMPGSSSKQWRAFLSVAADANGLQVNAIDRIGSGPWYDRNGKLVASTKSGLLSMRPSDGDVSIKNDLPNESGVSNKDSAGKNLEIMTGSNAQGELYGPSSSCDDWTSSRPSTESPPRVGHAWSTTACASGSGGGACNWMSAAMAAGCAAGTGVGSVGASNGYGGIYCFALIP